MKEKIAVIGGGVAGLTAGYLLSDKYEITLFEKDNRLGGNAYTLDTKSGEEIDISIFFYSPLEYPNFYKLIKKAGIKSRTMPMEGLSESFRDLKTNKEYFLSCDYRNPLSILSFINFRSLFHQFKTIWYYRKGIKMSKSGKFKGMTLREALKFLPGLNGDTLKIAIFPICIMTSMFWKELMSAPAEFVFKKIEKQCGTMRKFMSWRLYPCKTREYVNKLAEPFKNNVKLGSNVKSIKRETDSVIIRLENGEQYKFDKVIIACPADTALQMLEKPSAEERKLLAAWRYTEGTVIVHTDSSNYPPEKLWAMYGYLYHGDEDNLSLSINAYYRFQNGVPNNSKYIGIQHPNIDIDEKLIEFQQVFRTPIYDNASIATIEELPHLNGQMNTYYCGSHFGYGLHEDAVTSAIEVSKMLGAQWE